MSGMNLNTGRAVADLDHLRQSIRDILTTPIGTRLERRTYGSLVPDLIDHPDNNASQVRLFSAVASALLRWEPRFRLTRVGVQRDAERPGGADGGQQGNAQLYGCSSPRLQLR